MLTNVYVEGNQLKVTAWFLTPHTIGTCQAGSADVTVADLTGLAEADAVLLAGAGPEGLNLVTTIASIAGQVATLALPATTRVKWAAFGKLADPTTVTFKVEEPDGTLVTKTHPDAAIAHPQAGIFILTYDPPVSGDGTYAYRVEGTGNAQGAGESTLRIASSRIV
jgi:hypothetical protein